MIEIKEAILESEKQKVNDFLSFQDLKLDSDCDVTIYLEENNKIIGTISKSNYIIKCVAVDSSYQGEDLTGLLVNKIVEKLRLENIYSYQLFTKPKYEKVFTSLGFRLLAKSSDALMMEKGNETIYDTIDEMKRIIVNNLGKINNDSDIASVVINANPFTLGHQYLIEEISKRHDKVIIFLVSEDKSEFSFKERMALTYLATSRFKNTVIVPSSKYIVSKFTFPSYFIHSNLTYYQNIAQLDGYLFKEYFMKLLYIKKRYVGSETKDYMVSYNNILKDILKDDLVILDRKKNENGDIYSASKVRELIKNKNLNEALKYIPNECSLIFKGLVNQKYGL